jgi:phosphomannomutase
MNEENLIEKNYSIWTSPAFDRSIISKINKLKQHDIKEFNDSFYCNLSFGTGGMRGIVGLGPNRVNKYTFGMNTQGISNFINKIFKKAFK